MDVFSWAYERLCQRTLPSTQNIMCLADEWVPQKDHEVFVKMALEALQRIHEGSVARYRLKLSEFMTWKPIRDQFYQSTLDDING